MDTIAITVDCSADDFEKVAAFWAAALGYERVLPGYVIDPAGKRPRLAFEIVPEPKVVKNRWHVDLYVEKLEALEPRVRQLVFLQMLSFNSFHGDSLARPQARRTRRPASATPAPAAPSPGPTPPRVSPSAT